jgi:sugar/nucleoside kinase (ribokinase family)
VCLDRVMRVPALPKPGGYVEVSSEQTFLGGEAANTANALMRWHRDVRLVGNPSGDGVESDLLRQALEQKGLTNTADMLEGSLGGKAPVCDIYVTPDGERTMFGRGFSSMRFPLDPTSLPYQAGQWFTAEPNMSEVARAVVREAKAHGMKIYTMDFFRDGDPISSGDFWQSSTDWLAHKGDTERNIAWVKDWVARYGCFAILSDGVNGLVAGSPEFPVRHFPPFPAPKVVDTTGAGDMLRAGVLCLLDQDRPVEEALAFGAAAGSLKCGTLGATEHVPSIQDIERHIAAHPEIARQYQDG